MGTRGNGGWTRVALVAVGIVVLLVGAGSGFEAGGSNEQMLIATFGAGMGIFGIGLALMASERRSRLAWMLLWYYPVFFAVHIAAFETWIPDLPLLAIAAAALFWSRPRLAGAGRPYSLPGSTSPDS